MSRYQKQSFCEPKPGLHFRTSIVTESQKQFIVTCKVIYFTVQLSNKVSQRKNPSHQQSHTIDIDGGTGTTPTNGDVRHTSLPVNYPFSIEPQILTHMVMERNLESLASHGGVKSIALTLRTDETRGISSNVTEMTDRKRVFGSNNVYLKPTNKGLLSFAVQAARGVTIIQLLFLAVLSIGFGIMQQGPSRGWYDGLNILIATILVASISTWSNFSQSRQMEELYRKRNDVQTDVVRDGLPEKVFNSDIVVGDIVCLKTGDQIPADGLFLDGHSLEVDGSSISAEENPFLFSGTKVTNGFGRMLVTSVGMNTTWGQMMSSIMLDLSEETPLQVRIKKLTTFMSKIGVAVIIVVLLVLLIRYFSGHELTEANETRKPEETIKEILQFLLTAVTMAAGAKFECLHPALTLTLTSSMRRMIMDKCTIVRNPSTFETLASVTIICTDKTGTLTSKEMSVAEFCVGKDEVSGPLAVNNKVQELIYQAVGLNTTGSVLQVPSVSTPQISGSPTEKAIFDWAVQFGMDIGALIQNFEIMQVETHRSESKRSGVMAREKKGNGVQVHWKGGAEIILAMCSNYYDREGMLLSMQNEDKVKLNEIIKNMASKSLRCIAFAHKQTDEENLLKFNGSELTLLAIVGLKNPCRLDVHEAVTTCRNAKVAVKMITADNLFTAKAIAIECGIITPEEQFYDEAVVDGTEFRRWQQEERMQKIDKIRVIGRSSPSDKFLMVHCLKLKGHVVAVTGKRASDAAALKEAHVGLSMGVQGTQVAKESSGLVILDDNFASIVTALKWSRCAYTNILKTIQFQLTTTIVGHILNVLIFFFSGSAPLLRPDNLIVDTLSSLALVNEPLNDDIMTRPPVTGPENLLRATWTNMFIQIMGLVAILLALQCKGKSMFGVSDKLRDTIVFNCFVLCQVFHYFNVRSPENENIFEGVHQNKWFLGIVGTAIGLQVLQIMFLNSFEDTERLAWRQWGACVAIAAITWLCNWLLKCVQGLISI